MAEELKPCHCGHEGELCGIDHGAYLSLSCPECPREVTAFTMGGLVENWNKPAQKEQAQAGRK